MVLERAILDDDQAVSTVEDRDPVSIMGQGRGNKGTAVTRLKLRLSKLRDKILVFVGLV